MTLSSPILFPEWHNDAACNGENPGMFYLNPGENHVHALKVCAGCPVSNACLAYAIENREEHGVWGGTTPEDRIRMRQEAARVARSTGQPVGRPRKLKPRECGRCKTMRAHRARGLCSKCYDTIRGTDELYEYSAVRP